MRKNQRKRNLTIFFALLLAAVLLIAIPLVAHGFGDFDSGSDFGGGGSSWDFDSSSSDDDSDGTDILELIRFVLIFGDLVGLPREATALILVAIIAVVFVVKFRARTKNRGNISAEKLHQPRGDLSALLSADPGFDEGALQARVQSLFERMQSCWEAGNIEPLRKDFMPDTWTRFNTQLQNKNAVGETAHVRNIVFNEVCILSYSADDRLQKLSIRVDVTHNIWTTNREGRNIQGNENTRKRMVFLWTMTRPAGAVTGNQAADSTHCPNCGAEVDLEAFAECPFCHTPIMKVSQDWVISEIEAMQQETLNRG